MSLLRRLRSSSNASGQLVADKGITTPPRRSQSQPPAGSHRDKVAQRPALLRRTTLIQALRSRLQASPRLLASPHAARSPDKKARCRSRSPRHKASSASSAKRPRAERTSEEFVGTASELRPAHLKRHDGGRRDCGRCRY